VCIGVLYSQRFTYLKSSRTFILTGTTEDIDIGSIVNIRCDNCDYDQDFFTGVGETFTLEGIIKDWNNYQYKDLIGHLIKNHKIEKVEIENKIFWCPKCDNLQDNAYVHLEYNSNKSFITLINCDKCNTEMKPVQKVNLIEKCRCPDCGKRSLSLEETGIWD